MGIIKSKLNQNTDELLSIIELDKECYNAQPLKGEISLNIGNENLIFEDILVELVKEEKWKTVLCSEEVTDVILSQPVGVGKIIGINEKWIELERGSYTFPFTLDIPQEIQPSFDCSFDSLFGYIRYYVRVTLIKNNNNIVLKELIRIKSDFSQSSNLKDFFDVKSAKKLGMFSEGSTKMTVRYETHNYYCGESVKLNIEVNNEEGKIPVDHAKVNVIRRIKFFSKDGKTEKHKEKKKLYSENFPMTVRERSSKNSLITVQIAQDRFENLKNKHFHPYSGIEHLDALLPSCKGALITCEYSIKVTLYFKSFVTKDTRPRVILPLLITDRSVSQKELALNQSMQLISDAKIDENDIETVPRDLVEEQKEQVKHSGTVYNSQKKNDLTENYSKHSHSNSEHISRQVDDVKEI